MRWRVAGLCFLANVIGHCDRVSMSAAAPALMKEYGWDTARTGWVLSGFFLGYALLMIPVGLLVDRWGPRRVFAASMGWWSLCTALTPLPGTVGGLAAVRVLLGVGESGTAACLNATLVRWFPAHEYSRAAALCWSGGYAGPIVAFPLASYLLLTYGWRSIFFVFAGLGFLWLPLWLRTPEVALERKATVFPWAILGRAPVWAVFALHFSSNWFLYVMISWLPTYLLDERQFSLQGMAMGTSLPFLCAWVGANGFAQAIDRLSVRHGRTRVRKWCLVPYGLAAVSVLAVPVAPTALWTVALLCAAMALMTAATPIFASSSLDLAPEVAGGLASLQNAFANLAGIVAPVVIGYLVKGYGWSAAFGLTAAVAIAGLAAYAVWGRAERITA